MILIIFLFLKLSILHLCVSVLDRGYQCTRDHSSNNPEIFLVWDLSKTHRIGLDTFYQGELNFKFRRFCSNYYNITIGSLEDAAKHDNVIQFAVPGYYDGKPLNDFVYAGNVSKIDDAVCTKTDKAQPEFDCHEIVNLVSKSVLEINDGHVYNIVQEMHVRPSSANESFKIMHRESCNPFYQNTLDLMVVFLCLRNSYYTKEVNIHPLKLVQVSGTCSHYLNKITIPWESNWNRNRLLAVLAPEPFKVTSEYSVPTIFYETPYLFSENNSTFPNSMNLVPWRLLKYGFLTFIQTMGWQRVAIVTDDSEYSLDFEDELTALFNKERIMYTVIRCEDANCEMKKVAQELSRVSASIVIANVEKKHAQYLFQNAHPRITWLVRDMVGERQNQYLSYNQVAFSISLSTDTATKECNVADNILTGLNSIAQAYKNIAGEDYKGKKREFYRRFADEVKNVTPRITEPIYIKVHSLYDLAEISAMSVNATGAIVTRFTNPFGSGKPTDGTAHCLVTSYDYHNPCEDPVVMFIMFALMLFMLTFILIIRYFDKTSPFNERYQHF